MWRSSRTLKCVALVFSLCQAVGSIGWIEQSEAVVGLGEKMASSTDSQSIVGRTRLTVTVSTTLKEQVKAAAEARGLSLREWLVVVVTQALDREMAQLR